MKLASTIAILTIASLFFFCPFQSDIHAASNASQKDQLTLTLYCAAGLKKPVEESVKSYEKEHGVKVQVQYGGSGTLLSNLRVVKKGDLFLSADESYINEAHAHQLITETFSVAYQIPVIAVKAGNPKNIRKVDDLLKDEIRVALANPESASIGKVSKKVFEAAGTWDKMQSHAKVFKPTVQEVASDIKMGIVDTGILWDATVQQNAGLEAVASSLFTNEMQMVTLAVLKSSENPTPALRFARYLTAKDRGLIHFAKDGYKIIDGDAWAWKPELIFYSGALNRIAVEQLLTKFEEREGVEISRVYNGCGILVAQMKAGARPDAYLACDSTFVPPVADLFHEPVPVSETAIVILTPPGNPKNIRKLADLTGNQVKLGIANSKQSTLGYLTEKILKEQNLFDSIQPNIRSQTPTADLLVNQLRTGSLDAVIVYKANAASVKDKVEIISINLASAKAVQPFSVGKAGKHQQLIQRLFSFLTTNDSRRAFEQVGFNCEKFTNNSRIAQVQP